ncbi:MAG: hypothetical protein AB1486_19465 [Planctomycetota bacterium]
MDASCQEEEVPPAAPGSESGAATEMSPTPPETFLPRLELTDLEGYVRTRYRLRATYDETDQDVSQDISLMWGDPKRHRLTFSVLGEWSWDADGRDDPSSLYSIEDTFDSRVNGRLLRAWADLNRLGPLERLRFGRQELPSLPEVPLFDGVCVETHPLTGWNLRFRSFGGVPTHLYESSPSGDSLFGLGVETEPTSSTWAALTVANVRDSLVSSTERDNFVALELTQRILPQFRVSGRATVVEDEVRDLNLRAAYSDSDLGCSAQASYFTLLTTQRQLVTEFDPFFTILKEERPYHEWRVLLSKDIGERWTVEAGFSLRELRDDDEEGAFNHEYRRFHLTPTLHDWPLSSMDLSLTAELWEAEDQAFRSVGFEAAKDVTDDLRVELGSEFELFKFDPLLGDEREDVRSHYVKGQYELSDAVRTEVGLAFESDEQDTYRTMQVGLRWRF